GSWALAFTRLERRRGSGAVGFSTDAFLPRFVRGLATSAVSPSPSSSALRFAPAFTGLAVLASICPRGTRGFGDPVLAASKTLSSCTADLAALLALCCVRNLPRYA